MHKNTKAVHAGRYPMEQRGAVNPPIYQASTIIFPTLKAYNEAEKGKVFYKGGPEVSSYDRSYGITGTYTTNSLEEAIAAIEEADSCLILSSGLNAIVVAILGFVEAGDHILMADSVYGPTRRFCHSQLQRFNVDVTYYDPMIGEGIADLIQENTKIVYTESPGSLTFEIQDIPAISKAAKAVNEDIIVIMDNSWATPLYFRPYDHGVDVSIHAVTKYMGGHSDVLMGAITCRKQYFKTIYKTFHHFGSNVSPQETYLAQRGLRTLPTRLKHHEESALTIATWLQDHPKVQRVLHPAFESCPGHEIWKRDFKGSTGLFSIILDKEYSFDELSAMIDPMELFSIGCSWGGYESLVLALDPTSVRTATQWEKTGSMVRLYVGLEYVGDLKTDLEKALDRLG